MMQRLRQYTSSHDGKKSGGGDDEEAVDYYNDDDVERGYVEVANRRGIIEQFPLTTISIAVLEVDSKIYKNTLEIGEMASQIKHKAKTVLGSSYVINRRRF